MMAKYHSKDYEGKQFSGLTCVRFLRRDEKSHAIWEFKCECGSIIEKFLADVVSNRVKSCGCFRTRNRQKNVNWNGYKEISGNYWQIIKTGAKQRGLSVNVTIEDIWNQYEKQNGKCALTGLDLKFRTKSKSSDGTASLDRIDSKIGYEVDNIQWVHKDVNFMKMKYSQDYFIHICKLIAKKAEN